MEYTFRKAKFTELGGIWEILQEAIARRKAEGSNQWQDGYPNPDVIRNDIKNGNAYVLASVDGTLAGYCAVLMNDEPQYAAIEGKWLTEGDFLVIHRVAVATEFLGKGMGRKILSAVEELARGNSVYSIKADTNFDNIPMMTLFDKMGYVYCGQVYFRGSARRAYEKVLI